MHKMKGTRNKGWWKKLKDTATIGTVGTAVFLIVFIGVLAFLESPQTLDKEDISASFPVVTSELETTVSDKTEEEKALLTQLPTLENKLVDSSVVDGYIVETYQEYEVYKDKKGDVLESIATENFDYIRYKQ